MKTLIIMRHAKTEEGGAGKKDFDRELIFKGLKDASEMALWIRKKYALIDEIFSSAAKRTQHTASIVKEICGGNLILLDELYQADADEILDQIQQGKKNSRLILVVGHNPAVSELASNLSHSSIDLKPSDVVVFELDNKAWQTALKVKSFKHHSVY